MIKVAQLYDLEGPDGPRGQLLSSIKAGDVTAVCVLSRKTLNRLSTHIYHEGAVTHDEPIYLPECRHYNIVVDENGDLSYNCGFHVDNNDPIILRPDGTTNIRDHVAIRRDTPFKEVVQYARREMIGDIQPFHWSDDLFEGLFQDPMKAESKALLHCYFLLWADKNPEEVVRAAKLNFFDLVKENFCSALLLLRDTKQFKKYQEYGSDDDSTEEATPGLIPVTSTSIVAQNLVTELDLSVGQQQKSPDLNENNNPRDRDMNT